MNELLIVTDLDGSLLNHHNYDFSDALPTLQRLQQANIPVVFNTSKTRLESRRLARAMNLHTPCIVENGSAIWFPASSVETAPMGSVADSLDGEAGWLLLAGRDHAGIQQCLVPLRQQFRFRALSEASIDEVVAATDLSPEAAALARQREFSEPLLWQDDAQALTAFRSALQRCGCNLLKGGRFLHVIGNTDKGRAMQRLLQHYPAGPARPTVMALGDSDNDIDMLRAADIAAIIHSPLRPPPEVGDLPRLYRSKAAGAAGWAECVEQVLALQV